MGQMRWLFTEFDLPGSPEARERQALREAMVRWWEAFAGNADAVDRHFLSRAECDLHALMNILAEVHPNLMWEFGPAVNKSGHRLCITPECRPQLRPMLDVLLSLAPKLDRWEFYPYRLADAIGPDRNTIDGRTKISREGVTVSATRGRGNRIDLRYFLPDEAMKNEQDARAFAFYSTERFLGEEILDKWIGGIEALPQSAERQPGSSRLAFERLVPTVQAVIDSVLEQLPRVPRFAKQSAVEPGKPIGWSFKFPLPPDQRSYPARSDLLFGTSLENDLFLACQAPAFYSSRFSRCGETFCYLKLDRRCRPDLWTVDNRFMIQDKLTERLTAAGLGSHFAGASGKAYSYIDLALVDVRRSVPIIRDVLREERLSAVSWLLFFDATLKDEWIGGSDEAPAPPV
jgi:hypothetical protein